MELAKNGKLIVVATADARGSPHIGAAGRLSLIDPDRVAVTEWFCPGTTANIQGNRRIAVAVWDPEADAGFQLLGEVEKVEEVGVLDGYSAQEEGVAPMPQVERRIVVRVRRILDFKRAPHSDVEEQSPASPRRLATARFARDRLTE